MGVIVGEGRYMLAGDLLQAFLPLLFDDEMACDQHIYSHAH